MYIFSVIICFNLDSGNPLEVFEEFEAYKLLFFTQKV